MRKKLTLKDCTKENFEKSWKVLEDARKAYKDKDIELGKRWRDSGYDDNIYKENQKILKEYQDAINEAYKNIVPYVGLKCSIRYYSDSRACVITKVITPNKVVVMHLKYDTLDYYGCKYKVTDEINERMGVEVFSRRKKGVWATYGTSLKDYPCILWLNSTHHNIDPSF
ncbi:MAG: hypothetical protein ACI4N3_01600 [Alphaproteobacteria bacterium]